MKPFGGRSILAAVVGLGVGAASCTSAPPDSASGGSSTGGGSTGGASGTATGGSVVSGGAGGSSGAAGPSGGTNASGGVSGSAGAPAGSGGSAGSAAGGGNGAGSGGVAGVTGGTASGAGGAGASGGSAGSPAALGCDWENPAGRILLFDGTSLAAWRNARTGGAAQWRLVGDGTMEVAPADPPTDIHTVMTFEDLCVHLEYMTPSYPSTVTGQERGNSGIYLKHAYEMQVLDSFGRPPTIDSCGAVYSVAAPLVVACYAELVWNSYEIEFRSSRWDSAGRKTENAAIVSATLNGRVVHTNLELDPPGGATTAGQPDAPGPKPLMLQDHRNLIRFRNIWVKVPRYGPG